MKQKILGSIGVLWGGAILVNGLLGQAPQGTEAYQSGQTAALIFGALMLLVGAFSLLKKK